VSGGRFLLATRSEGKLRELREIFSDFGVDVVDLSTLGIPVSADEQDLEEFETFEQNALAKARYFFQLSG
jgi:XTP/dITP diphosphohydrolase